MLKFGGMIASGIKWIGGQVGIFGNMAETSPQGLLVAVARSGPVELVRARCSAILGSRSREPPAVDEIEIPGTVAVVVQPGSAATHGLGNVLVGCSTRGVDEVETRFGGDLDECNVGTWLT